MEKFKQIIEGLLTNLDPSNAVITESIKEDLTNKFLESVSAAIKSETDLNSNKLAEQLEIINKELDNKLNEQVKQHELNIEKLTEGFNQILSKLDEESAAAMELVVSTFDDRSVQELNKVKEAFESYLDKEIDDLCESVEAIIDNKLEESNPTEELEDLSKLAKYRKAFESMRNILYKDVVLDELVEESVGTMKSSYDTLIAQNLQLTKELNKIKTDKFLESKLEGAPIAKRKFLEERFEGSTLEQIEEDWDDAIDEYVNIDERIRRKAKSDADKLKIDEDVDFGDKPVEEITESIYNRYSDMYSNYLK